MNKCAPPFPLRRKNKNTRLRLKPSATGKRKEFMCEYTYT